VTPDHAQRLATRWSVVFLATLVTRLALRLVGIDEFDLPMQIAEAFAVMIAAGHSGWARGYRDHAKTREDA
jgi:hypothetical protein